MKYFFTFLYLIFIKITLYSQLASDFNNYDQYLKLESKNFVLYYPRSSIGVVSLVASKLDSIYNFFTDLYDYKPSKKTRILIHDEDISNGWAAASINTIAIWPIPMEYLFRGTHEWLRDVISHEFSHIITISPSYKIAPYIPDIRLAYVSSLDNKKEFTQCNFPYSLSILPAWFTEGLAQYGSYKFGGDRFDTHREMMLRTDVKENSLLTLDEMMAFQKNALNSEKVYNHGFSFVKFLADSFGINSLKDIIKESKKFSKISFRQAFKSAVGISLDSAYNLWKMSLQKRYQIFLDTLNNISGIEVFSEGFYNIYPFKWHNRILFFSTLNRDYGPLGLVSIRIDSLIKQLNSDSFEFIKDYEILLPVANYTVKFSNDTSWALISSFEKRGRYIKDIQIFNIEDKKKIKLSKKPIKIKKGFRALYTEISSNDSLICYVRNKNGFNVLGYMNKDLRVLKEKDKIMGNNVAFYTPRFDSLGNYIIFSYFINESRNIGIWNLKKDSIYPFIAHKGYDERDPIIYKNYIIYSADYNGVFNLYAYDYQLDKYYRITNEYSGAFMPLVVNDSLLVYSKYTNNGYILCAYTNWQEDFVEVEIEDKNIYKPLKFENYYNYVKANSTPYNATPNSFLISPILISDAQGSYRTLKIGASFFIFDPLMKVSFGLFGVFDALKFGQSIMNRDFGGLTEIHLLPWTISALYVNSLINNNIIYKNNKDGRIKKDSVNYIIQQFGINNRYQINKQTKIHLYYLFSKNSADQIIGNEILGYDYYNGNGFGLMLSYFDILYKKDMDYNPSGVFDKLRIQYNDDKLIKKGEAWEVLYVSPTGILKAKNQSKKYFSLANNLKYYTDYYFNFFKINLDFNILSLFNADVDSFFYSPNSGISGISSYPLKKDSANWYYSGTNNIYLKLAVRMPIFTNIAKNIGPWYLDKLYFDLFGEYAFSDNKFFNINKMRNNSLKGLGINFRLGTIINYSIPWEIDVKVSWPWENKTVSFSKYKLYFTATYDIDDLSSFDSPFF